MLLLGVGEKTQLDRERLRTFATYGFIIYGPMLQLTYNQILPRLVPEVTRMAIMKKILFTQTAFALTSICAFYTAIPLL